MFFPIFLEIVGEINDMSHKENMFGCLAESSMRSLSAKWNIIRIPVTATCG